MRYSLAFLLIAFAVLAVLFATSRYHLDQILPDRNGPTYFGLALLGLLLVFARSLPWMFVKFAQVATLPAHRWGGLWLVQFVCGRRLVGDVLNNEGLRCFERRQYERALELFSKAAAVDPFTVEYRLSKSAALQELGRGEEALAILDRLPSSFKEQKRFFARRGVIYFRLGRLQEAADDLAHCGETACDNETVAYVRGSVHFSNGEWEAALRDVGLACKLNRGYAPARILLAGLQACSPIEAHRNAALALENARIAAMQLPADHWIPASVLAAAHAEGGDFISAVRFARDALRLAPEEEKAERQQRLELFESGRPYRYPEKKVGSN